MWTYDSIFGVSCVAHMWKSPNPNAKCPECQSGLKDISRSKWADSFDKEYSKITIPHRLVKVLVGQWINFYLKDDNYMTFYGAPLEIDPTIETFKFVIKTKGR